MTKKDFLNLKRQIDKLFEEAENEALREGINITSNEFQLILLEIKKGILTDKGIGLEDYERLEEELETGQEVQVDKYSLIKLGKGLEKETKEEKEKFQQTIKEIKEESSTKINALAQESDSKIQDLSIKSDSRQRELLTQLQTLNSNLIKEIKKQRDISSSQIAEAVRMVGDSLIVKEKQIEGIKSQNTQIAKYQEWLKKYQEWLLGKVEGLEKRGSVSPDEKKRLQELNKKNLDNWLEDYLRNWTSWPVRGMRLDTQLKSGFIDNETPAGIIDGSNKTFTLTYTPNPATSLKVYVNGARMTVTEDYTLSGKTLTMVTAPPTNSIFRVDYKH